MKKYFFIAVIFSVIINISFGEIKNGYASGVKDALESLKSLQGLRTNNDLTPYLKRRIKVRIQALTNFIAYHELTDNLLTQFRMISPELYAQIDSIRDVSGRPTDVFVKFIPPEESKIMAAGITSIGQAEQDKNLPVSEYGEGTVSVKIWIVNEALYALSHEFGHVNYVIPNLARYVGFYRANYPACDTEENFIGHDQLDLSGKNAFEFEKKFQKDCFAYFNRTERMKNPIDIVINIRRRIHQEMAFLYQVAAL